MDYSSRMSFQDGTFRLPNIQGGFGSPPPIGDSQLMPYSGRRTNLSTSVGNIQPYDNYDGGNVKGLEHRLNVAEQSNRALLDEVVKLQGELKHANKRTDDGLAAERRARLDLTENLRTSNDLISQLGARLKRAEDKAHDGKTALDALVNHTKQVEKGVVSSHQEIVSRRDKQFAKIVELRNDLDEANRLRDQMERATATMVDEIRTLKSMVDTQQMEFNGVLHELKERAKRLEDENRQALYESKKINDGRNILEQEMAQLRVQMNMRVGEIRDVLIDMRNRVQQEESDRRRNESQSLMKMNELQSQIHDQGRKREEAIHALDAKQRDREHAANNERLKLQGKLAETAEELNKNITNKEIRIREEMQQKFGSIEQIVHSEQTARAAHEQAMREENEQRWSAMQRLTYDEILNVKANHKVDYKKLVDGLNKTTEAIGIVERHQEETKKQHEQVMREERQSREVQDKRIRQMDGKTENVQENLTVAISSLQEAIGGISAKVNKAASLSDEKQKSMLNEVNRTGLRGLADLDARLMVLRTKLDKQEDLIDARVADGLKTQGDSNTDMFYDLSEWRDSTDSILKELKEKVDSLEPEGHQGRQQTDSPAEMSDGRRDRVDKIEDDLYDLTTRIDKLEPKVSESINPDEDLQGLKDDVNSLMDIKESHRDTQNKIDVLDKDIKDMKKDIEELKEQKGTDPSVNEVADDETPVENRDEDKDDPPRSQDDAPDNAVPQDGEQNDGNKNDGNQDDGNQNDGNQNDGNQDDGNQNDGNQNNGNQDDGNQNDGNQNDGNQDDGNQNDGNQNDGNQDDGNQNDGNQNDGNQDDGNQNDGNRDGNQNDKTNDKTKDDFDDTDENGGGYVPSRP
ncbi:uncharacterized protein LOC144435582 [Glandiceps talaboti]